MAKTKIRYKNFVNEYLINGNNATQAYKKISPKVTKRTAITEGQRYLTKPYVQELIKKNVQKVEKKHGITFESQLNDLKNMREDIKKKDSRLWLDCLKEENKMIGLYAPTQTVNKNVELTPKQLADELKKDVDVL